MYVLAACDAPKLPGALKHTAIICFSLTDCLLDLSLAGDILKPVCGHVIREAREPRFVDALHRIVHKTAKGALPGSAWLIVNEGLIRSDAEAF